MTNNDEIELPELYHPGLTGCSDGGCIIKPPQGMHTNGGCGCERTIRRGTGAAGLNAVRTIHYLRDQLRQSRHVPTANTSEGCVKESAEREHERAQAAEPVALMTSKDGGPWPTIGEKYIVRLGGVLQHEIYEFDQGDDGIGGGEHFWSRDDIDECPAFDPERDEWLQLSALDRATPARPAVTEEQRRAAGIAVLNHLNGSESGVTLSGKTITRIVDIALKAALGGGE